jgi:GNAT superfamily N-acetyltransferase
MSQSSHVPPRSPLAIKPFSPIFANAGFGCGVKRIDRYLQDGSRIEEANFAKLFVGVERTRPNFPIGYYAFHSMHIDVGNLPNDLTANLRRGAVLGAVYVAMLGVDTRYQRQGFGTLLFSSALKKSKAISQTLGTWAVVLDALDPSVIPFYSKFGFQPLQQGTNRLFLPIASIP